MNHSEESTRFQRQIMLPEVGLEGQKRLQKAKILIVGSGGLASSAAYYLTAAGIGKIGIADDDQVDLSNLNRQILHDASRIGMPKVASAQKTLQGLHPALEVETYPRRLASSEELFEVLTDYDLIVDCTDNYTTRFNINDACIRTGKPWIYGAVFGFEGQAMTIIPGKGPCYRCLYPSAPSDVDSVVPVMGVTPGIIGLIEATEAIKHILGVGTPLLGRMLFVDLLDMSISEFKINRNANCPACGQS
jgi:molybdopterin/thiamine biosynthesis adenylyltransferase